MRFLLNLSSVAAHPTGLGSYAMRIGEHVVDRYAPTVLAPAYLSLPPHADRIETPAHIAIATAPKSRLARLRVLAQRQLFHLRGPIGRDDFVYTPTHHGFFNTRQQIVTIHDLISLHYPENFPRQAQFFRKVMPRIIARSRAVFTVSEATRQEVIEFFRLDPERVFVVSNMIEPRVPTVPVPDDKEDYLLVVGCHLPHKNIEEILHVAPLWTPHHTLKIVGATGNYGHRIRALVGEMGLGAHVEFVPFVADTELDRLYRGATALLYPSLVEGFGLPPLEALTRGTRAVVSNIAVHREVMGEAATFVTLGDETSWAHAFATLAAERGMPIDAAARAAVLDRYGTQTVTAQFDRALATVAPDVARIIR